MDAFLSVLMKNLIEAKNKYPDQYNWQHADILDVFRRFAESMREGTYTRHCHAIKWTCKELGIPNTRQAIDKIFTQTKEQ